MSEPSGLAPLASRRRPCFPSTPLHQCERHRWNRGSRRAIRRVDPSRTRRHISMKNGSAPRTRATSWPVKGAHHKAPTVSSFRSARQASGRIEQGADVVEETLRLYPLDRRECDEAGWQTAVHTSDAVFPRLGNLAWSGSVRREKIQSSTLGVWMRSNFRSWSFAVMSTSSSGLAGCARF